MNHRIIELVEMLQTVPTGDNAQPFRFSVTENTLEVTHLNDVAHHNFNQAYVASLLSLGMMTFIIKNFAAKNKLSYKIQHSRDFNLDQKWLTCEFSPSASQESTGDEDLLNYLSKRRTDRRLYRKEAFNFDDFNKTFDGKIKFKDSLSSKSYGLISRFENMIFDDLETFKHIEAWVRYSKKEMESTHTGMSCANMGIDPVNSGLFRHYKHGTFVNHILNYWFKFIMILKVRVNYPRSIGFGLCTLTDTSNAGIIDMGEHILKAWLKLTKMGYTLQPISSPTLVSFLARNRNGKFISSYKDEAHACSETFTNEFGVKGEVIWLFRFGKPLSGAEKHRTLRLPLKKILTNKSEAA